MNQDNKASICMECINGGGLCSWSSRCEPVPGWTAEPKKLRANGRKHMEDSYTVTACPSYGPRRRRGR